MATQSTWQAISKEKKARQEAAIPKEWRIKLPADDVIDIRHIPEECGLLTKQEIVITNTDVKTLIAKLASAQWSSVDVTRAFCKRAIIAHQLTNCLTEIMIDLALARAAELDEHLKKTGRPVGPMHGLPVSLKDQVVTKGFETTMGYASWVGTYAEKDAVLLTCLYEAGIVPYVRTNVPQTLMWPDTYNYVFGRTTNPCNRTLTPGGSSGGESALLMLKGSPLGIGSDIAGSIRVPAAFTGLYGLRPSYNRFPYSGAVTSMDGQESIQCVFGPLAHDLHGIKTMVKAIAGTKPWLKDPLCAKRKWDESEYQLSEHGGGQSLCFGMMYDDGTVLPQPPIVRGMEITKAALEAAGHRVVPWKAHKHGEMCEVMGSIWAAGAAEDYKVTITDPTGEEVIGSMEPATETGPVLEATFRPSDKAASAYALWQFQKAKRTLREENTNKWNATASETFTGRPVDAIISPVAPYAATQHGKFLHPDYTMWVNGYDLSSCVFPVTTVDQKLDVQKPAHKFMTPQDKTCYDSYNVKHHENSPIALQLVGRSYEEEAVIGMTEIVAEALDKYLGRNITVTSKL